MAISIDIEISNTKIKIENLQQKLEILRQAKSIIENPTGIVKKQRIRNSNSIGALLIQILKEKKAPLHVKDIKIQLGNMGKETTSATVTGICVRLVKEGLLKKTYPNTFDLVTIYKE